MRVRSIYLVWLFVSLASISLGAAEKKEPTLSQTLRWLETKFESGDLKADLPDGRRFRYEMVIPLVDSPQLFIIVYDEFVPFYEKEYRFNTNAEFPLKRLDPDRISVMEIKDSKSVWLCLAARTEEKDFKIQSRLYNPSGKIEKVFGVQRQTELRLALPDKAIAERVAEAFRHAARLAQKPPASEPF